MSVSPPSGLNSARLLGKAPTQGEYDPGFNPWIDEQPPAIPTHIRTSAPIDQPPQRSQHAPKVTQISDEVVLIDRRSLDRTLPYAKAAASILGWGNSLVTTMFTAAQIQVFISDRPATVTAYVVGFVAAVVLTLAQIYTSGRSRTGYAIVLFPDALMTSVQWCQWLLLPLCIKLLPGAWWLAALVASLTGGILGIISARLPERLTFGK